MRDNREQFFMRRVKVLGFLFGLGLVIVLSRVAQFQVFEHEKLFQLGTGQSLKSITMRARRGHLYDRNGVPLASSIDVPSVYANPMLIRSPQMASRRLAKVLGLSAHKLKKRLSVKKYFVWLKRQVSPAVAARILDLDIAGVGLVKEPKRFYPNKQTAAHVIGFTGIDGAGLEGMERQWDRTLAAQEKVVTQLRDARGQTVLGGLFEQAQPAAGRDVWLTLDIHIQDAVERSLSQAVQRHQARAGMAVVLDVDTADVLAMAVVPTFNPNLGAREVSWKRRNRAVTDIFEPGSTMKPLVLAAALQADVVKSFEKIDCEQGRWSVGGHRIRDGRPYGHLSVTDIIRKSSNIGAVKIGLRLSKQQLSDALQRFGFARKSDLALPIKQWHNHRPYPYIIMIKHRNTTAL